MTFEMTRDYNTILPVVISSSVSYAIRKALSHESIYTLKLLRRGHVVPEGLQAAVDLAKQAGHVVSKNFRVLAPSSSLSPFAGITLVANVDHDGSILYAI